MPPTLSPEPPPGAPKNPAAEGMNEAAASLAPHRTNHGHRPDWQTARDDQAESQRTD